MRGDGRKTFYALTDEGDGNKKWAEYTDDDKDVIRASIENRQTSLDEAVVKAELNAEIYLLSVSAAAGVGLFGKSLSVFAITDTLIVIALACFLLSVISVGIIKAARIIRTYYIRGEWKKNCKEFTAGQITYDQLLERDETCWRIPMWLIIPSIGAFTLFVFGIVFSVAEVIISIGDAST